MAAFAFFGLEKTDDWTNALSGGGIATLLLHAYNVIIIESRKKVSFI
jgi:hypothetical protein